MVDFVIPSDYYTERKNLLGMIKAGLTTQEDANKFMLKKFDLPLFAPKKRIKLRRKGDA